MLMNGHEEHTGLIFNRKLNEEMLCVEKVCRSVLLMMMMDLGLLRKKIFKANARQRERERAAIHWSDEEKC